MINILRTSSHGPILLKSFNSGGTVKDDEYFAKLFVKAIENVDPQNVVQVITDVIRNL